jgi:spore maturation protein SpmB
MSITISVMAIVGWALGIGGLFSVILSGFGRNVEHLKGALIVLCVGCAALGVSYTLRAVYASEHKHCSIEELRTFREAFEGNPQ